MFILYNAGQKSWDNSRFTPSPITMLIFNGRENADDSIDGLEYFNIVWGKGDSKKCSKRTICVSVIRVEVCVVKFSSFRPTLSSVPRSYDLHCSLYPV